MAHRQAFDARIVKREALIVACALAEMANGCLAVAFLLSSPAASPGGGQGRGTPKAWDTDNLRYAAGSYSARSFNIPFHQHGGYSETACQSGVADPFFQAGDSGGAVNDFSYLD